MLAESHDVNACQGRRCLFWKSTYEAGTTNLYPLEQGEQEERTGNENKIINIGPTTGVLHTCRDRHRGGFVYIAYSWTWVQYFSCHLDTPTLKISGSLTTSLRDGRSYIYITSHNLINRVPARSKCRLMKSRYRIPGAPKTHPTTPSFRFDVPLTSVGIGPPETGLRSNVSLNW